eukprot:1148080-Pelagomonas_calceolata.AAC.6
MQEKDKEVSETAELNVDFHKSVTVRDCEAHECVCHEYIGEATKGKSSGSGWLEKQTYLLLKWKTCPNLVFHFRSSVA